jgi:hypothetical protein
VHLPADMRLDHSLGMEQQGMAARTNRRMKFVECSVGRVCVRRGANLAGRRVGFAVRSEEWWRPGSRGRAAERESEGM